MDEIASIDTAQKAHSVDWKIPLTLT